MHFVDSDAHTEERTETIKINTNGNGKQTVGIRTDITFEIADDKNGTAKSEGRETNNDDEVPVVRSGDGVIYTSDGAKKADERIDFDMNKPIYHRTNDENFDGTGGTWVNFFPMASSWTTERSFLNRDNGKLQGLVHCLVEI